MDERTPPRLDDEGSALSDLATALRGLVAVTVTCLAPRAAPACAADAVGTFVRLPLDRIMGLATRPR